MADGLSDADRDLLAQAPTAVFLLVAGADGSIDQAERGRFEAMLNADHNAGSEVITAILTQAVASHAATLEALQAGDTEALLERVEKLASAALGAEDCAAYKQGLWMMGEAIARSSGGGLLGLGDRVDGNEKIALRRLRELLRIEA